MERDGLELLIVFAAFIVSLLFRMAYKYKWPLSGKKFGVIIVNPVLNNRNKILEGFIEEELIKRGAKAVPVGLHILRDIFQIENLQNMIFYHNENLDFLIIGELETEPKEVIIKTLDLNKTPGQEILDLPKFINKRVKTVNYSLNFKVSDYQSRFYIGTGYSEYFKLLDDSIELVFEKISKDVVDSIHIDSENRKLQKTLAETNNVKK